jgi:hypothetical protein
VAFFVGLSMTGMHDALLFLTVFCSKNKQFQLKPGGAALHASHVGVSVGRLAAALGVINHLAQALHGCMVGFVQAIKTGREQFYRLADATRLVDAALLADRQVHGQMQKRPGVLRGLGGFAGLFCRQPSQRRVNVGQFGMVFGVLGDPQVRYGFNSFQRLTGLGFGVNRTEKPADVCDE